MLWYFGGHSFLFVVFWVLWSCVLFLNRKKKNQHPTCPTHTEGWKESITQSLLKDQKKKVYMPSLPAPCNLVHK